MTVVVRTAGEGVAVAEPVWQRIRPLNPGWVVPEFRPLEEIIASSVSGTRFVASLLSLFAAAALGLAALGLFGLLSFGVAQRTREFGIRRALGADVSHVVRIASGRAIRLVAIGLAIGLAGGLSASRAMRSMLYETTAADPLTMIGVSGLLLCCAMLAAWLPARRAASVDPAIALRDG